MAIEIRDMLPEDEMYVGTCTHAGESAEIDREGARRVVWLRSMEAQGLRTWAAFVDGQRAGFAYAMPIEVCPWGPLGTGLLALPCLFVPSSTTGHGVGRALVQAAEEEARRQGLHGLATIGYFHDFWLFPAPFYERCGFQVLARQDTAALLWKPFDAQAQPPRLPTPQYAYTPTPGKVVVDLFWNIFCSTSDRGPACARGSRRIRRCRSVARIRCLRPDCLSTPPDLAGHLCQWSGDRLGG
ncbi:MAG: GNAT family N-acetyltransferase [Gammaproteobacteria bacterium]|nr:GNAT family N-acetyltransferase [Gammaproteobacteria bacterium]